MYLDSFTCMLISCEMPFCRRVHLDMHRILSASDMHQPGIFLHQCKLYTFVNIFKHTNILYIIHVIYICDTSHLRYVTSRYVVCFGIAYGKHELTSYNGVQNRWWQSIVVQNPLSADKRSSRNTSYQSNCENSTSSRTLQWTIDGKFTAL